VPQPCHSLHRVFRPFSLPPLQRSSGLTPTIPFYLLLHRTFSDSNVLWFYCAQSPSYSPNSRVDFRPRIYPSDSGTLLLGLTGLAPLSQWWETTKDHEGILQIFGRGPDSKVSDECFTCDRAEQLTTSFQDCIPLGIFYNGSEDGPKIFQRFYDLSE